MSYCTTRKVNRTHVLYSAERILVHWQKMAVNLNVNTTNCYSDESLQTVLLSVVQVQK
jgi:hypothetical protein